jgi:hypothetical protein
LVAEVQVKALAPQESHLLPSDYKKYPAAHPPVAIVVEVNPYPARELVDAPP